ncbi:DNA-processing protein DprA [Sarcina ventriculi]|uniref:DNA-processing protein DprA n=1 Tax=Sarcina ventriculi TaxID=1267 RepID=UPI0018AC0CC2|nr:DNA-processing protein DprA [Sarcina ventriculi]
MNKKYYIALQLMGLTNELIIEIMENVSIGDLKRLFGGDVLDIEFKYNIHFDKHIKMFESIDYLQKKIVYAENIIKKNNELEIKTILYINRYYPKRLKTIKNPPAIIYLRGKNITKLDDKSIACIGTRNPTNYGISAAQSIIGSLSREKFTIISGLAYGIDTIAHKVCLNNNARTIGVLAHGLDMIYPKENEDLANSILKNNGTLISEYPVGTKVDKFRFVNRNRIVSGLASGILMLEAKAKSGTMRTINFAKEQNKEIFCPSFNQFSLQSSLNLELLKNNKATPIYDDYGYVIILHKLGYKVKYDINIIKKIKSDNINNIITDSKFGFNNSFDLDKETYTKFKDLLKQNNITCKEFFNSIINNIVSSNGGNKNE